MNVKSKPPGPFALGAVTLGAGRSARMGRPKLLLPWGKTSILAHLHAQWRSLGAQQIAIVCAVDDQAMKGELQRLGIPSQECVFNPAPERGMFSSIQCAARWPGWNPDLTHWALVLGDQPHLRKETLEAVLDLCAKQPAKVCQPAYRGNRRHPVLLPKAVFARLAVSEAGTLKEFLAAYEIAACETDDAGLDLDIDRPEDYERAQQWWNQRQRD